MALYYAVGGKLLRATEVRANRAKILDLQARKLDKFEIGARALTASRHAFEAASPLLATAVNPFEPIGPGKPLTITIVSVYPGNLPPKKGGLFGRSRGVLVSSAVKSWQTFDAQPRALNVLKRSVARFEPIPVPAATEEGTRLVFYTPALIDRSLTLTVEVAIDDVNEPLFTAIGGIFKEAGGLPIFASAAPYLLAAGALFRLGGQIANAIFDNRAEFQGTEIISFDVGGEETAVAGYVLLTRNELEDQALDALSIGKGGILQDASGQPYQGPTPYAVLALDGRPDSKLEEFKSTAASAALLQQFYNVRENGETPATALIEALSLYSDYRFRLQADDVARQLKQPGLSKEETDALQAKLDAIRKNIKQDYFKPQA